MAQLPKSTLKSYYETGDIPIESEFASLIDSLQSTLIAGDNITLSTPDPLSGVVTISASTGNPYVLPIANSTTLGGVKPVSKTSGMTQDVGVDATGKLYTLAYSYTLPPASDTTLGGIYANELPSSDNSYECKISTSSKLYASVPVASGNQLGVIKVGSGLSVDSTGTLNVLQANSSSLGGLFLYNQTGQNTNGSVTQKVITDLTDVLKSAVSHLGNGDSIRVLKDDSEQAIYLLFCTTQEDSTIINNIIASQGNGLIATQGLASFPYTDDVSVIQSKLVGGIVSGTAAEIKLNTSKAKFDNWSGVNLTRWAGTSTQYNSIASKDANTLYFATGSGVYIGSTKIADIGGGGSSYVLPPATTSVLGGVIVGSGLNVNTSGLLSVKAATASVAGITKIYPGTGNNTDGTMDQNTISSFLNNKANKSDTVYVGTTGVQLNRVASALTLADVSITGSAGKVGHTLTITGAASGSFDGSADATINIPTYTLPQATQDTLGGVKIGANIGTDSNGRITVGLASASGAGVLTADNNSGLSVANGLMKMKPATTSTIGGVIIGDNLPVDNTGKISLPLATVSNAGIVAPGTGLTVGSGVMSVKTGTPTEVGGAKLYTATGSNTDGTLTQAAITTALGNTKSETISQVEDLIKASRYSAYSDWGSTPPSGNLIPLTNLSDDGNILITFLSYGTSIVSYTLGVPATGKEGCQFTFVFNNNANLSMPSGSGWTLYKSSSFNSMPADIGDEFLKVVSGVIIGGNKIIINSAFYSA